MNNYAKIHQYLIDNPDASLESVSRQFNVPPGRIKRNVARLYGYGFDDRFALIEQKKTDYEQSQWPAMKEALDTEDVNYWRVAQRFSISRDRLSRLIKTNGYDIKARANRIRRKANTKIAVQKRKVENKQVEQAVLIHSLPLKDLWKAVA